MPVKFEVYRDGQRLMNFAPVAVFAVGPESVPISGEVVFKDGLLIVGRNDPHSVGLSLLWDVGALGAYELETTRLPPREQAYVLNVELARLRLMKIVQKQEDWNLFDFPKAEALQTRFREAQSIFADALGKLSEPAAAATLADEALRQAILISEELALFHSELLLNRRASSKAFVKHIFGCRVNCTIQNQKYRDLPAGRFDYAVLPTSWKMLCPQEGVFEPECIDAWLDALNKARMPVIAGPLINLVENDLPDWLFIWENDFDTLRELAYEQVQRLVQRYRRKIQLWNVVGGISTNSAFNLSFEQMIELTRLLVAQVKNLLPSARTLITITQPFGEYHAKTPSSVAPMLYAEMAAQAGINFDGYALELELGVPRSGRFMRDLFQVSALLDRFSAIGRPVFITATSVPGRAGVDANDESEGRLDPAHAGRWHRPWDPQLQADWLEAVYRIALSKPFVESIAWADLSDLKPSTPSGGLLDDMFGPKPAFDRLQQMREKFSHWTRK